MFLVGEGDLYGEVRKAESLLMRRERGSFGRGVAILGATASSPSPTSSTTGSKKYDFFFPQEEFHLRSAMVEGSAISRIKY